MHCVYSSSIFIHYKYFVFNLPKENAVEIKQEIVDGTLMPTAVATLAYVVRVVVKRKKITPLNFLLDLLSAAFVGIIVSNVLYAYTLPQQVHVAIIAMSGVIGPDLLAGLLVLMNLFKNSPSSLLMQFLNAFKGETLEDASVKEIENVSKSLDSQNANGDEK